MEGFRQNSRFGVLLLLSVAALGLEGWFWARHRGQARRALVALERKVRERDGLVRQSPALSVENEQAIARDLAGTRKVLAALRAALQDGEGGTPAAPPGQAVDLFFDLAAFVEKMRVLAARARVALKPDERFGFAAHAHEGPGTGLVPAVFRQRVAAQRVLEALIEARPHSLLAVQRERPPAAAQRSGRNPAPASAEAAATGGRSDDFFDFDPALAARVPGQVDSDAFRLEFTGRTSALREFLNTLAGGRPPVIIRSVEVEPLADETPGNEPAAATGAPMPLVAQNHSRFAVVVEAIRLVDAAGEPRP